jgi:HK97 family phage major capsid protein
MTRKEQYQTLCREQRDFMTNTVKERKAADASFDFTKDESYLKRDAEIGKLMLEIRADSKLEEQERTFDHSLQTRENGRSNVTGGGDPKDVEIRNFVNYITTGSTNDLIQQRANLASNGTTTGGYLVPTFVSAQVIQDLEALESVRQAGATVYQVQGNENIPVFNDAQANFIQEAQTVTATDPTTGRVVITPNLLVCKTTYSYQLANRSAANVVDQIRASFVRGIAKKEAAKFITGTGTNEPQGVAIGGTAFNAADDTTFTGAELISMYYSLNPSFAANGTWIMSPSAAAMARGLSSDNGALLWYPNLSTGTATLFGRPVIIDANLPAIAASAVGPVVFGDFSNYIIGEETGLSVLSDPYSAAGTGEIKLYVYKFVDGRVGRAAAFQVMTMHA